MGPNIRYKLENLVLQLHFIVSDSDILDSDKKFAGGVCQRKAQFLQRTFGSGKLPNETLHEWSGPSPPLKVTIGKRYKVTFRAYCVLWTRFCVNSGDRFFLFPNFLHPIQYKFQCCSHNLQNGYFIFLSMISSIQYQ